MSDGRWASGRYWTKEQLAALEEAEKLAKRAEGHQEYASYRESKHGPNDKRAKNYRAAAKQDYERADKINREVRQTGPKSGGCEFCLLTLTTMATTAAVAVVGAVKLVKKVR